MKHQPIPIPRVTCYQCGHKWIPRKSVLRQCSRCQSKRWNEPKREKTAAVNR